jgi:hypothetical protein
MDEAEDKSLLWIFPGFCPDGGGKKTVVFF